MKYKFKKLLLIILSIVIYVLSPIYMMLINKIQFEVFIRIEMMAGIVFLLIYVFFNKKTTITKNLFTKWIFILIAFYVSIEPIYSLIYSICMKTNLTLNNMGFLSNTESFLFVLGIFYVINIVKMKNNEKDS